MQRITTLGTLWVLLLLVGCGPETGTEGSPPEAVPETLPMTPLSLQNLSAFDAPGANWQVAGGVYADYLQHHHLEAEPGTGVLVNLPTEAARENLFTTWDHGDLELDLEVMMPQGSNSGIYLQGRYEVQLFDSWGKAVPTHADLGGIYQRWDEARPEGEKGYEGHAPRLNASKAPGLWQHLHILFRAPRFDGAGNKVAPAKFEEVWLNGVLVQEDVPLTGPTRAAAFEDEVPRGPLMIQGDHGPVAFRHIQYKAFVRDSLTLSDLTYTLYGCETCDAIPQFDTLTPVKSGQATHLDVGAATDRDDHFALVFEGKLEVPLEGDYLFETRIDDGGDLFIDGKSVVHNEGDPGMDVERAIFPLTAGTHELRLTYYDEVWTHVAMVLYEGPGIEKRALAPAPSAPRRREPQTLVITDLEAPEMIRGFVQFGSEKKTHTISVGSPDRVHFSYDLKEAALLVGWKGDFADVTNMWVNRGESQLLRPLNAAVALTAGFPLQKLAENQGAWGLDSSQFAYRGYRVEKDGYPTFLYAYEGINMEDAVRPASKGLLRSLRLTAGGPQRGCMIRLAAGQHIRLLANGLYAVEGAYYLSLPEGAEPLIRDSQGNQELLIPVLENEQTETFNFEIIW